MSTTKEENSNKDTRPAGVLSSADILQQLERSRSLWRLQDNLQLSRSYTALDFKAALDSINAMGVIAEERQHHPDFHLTSYREVEVVLYTHTLGGVTERDMELAKLFDEKVQVVYSKKWLSEHPTLAARIAELEAEMKK